MSTAPARIAVVGLGKMGIMHAANVAMNPSAELVAICDRDAALGRHVRSMGVSCPFHTDVGEMLDRVRPDGVIVSVPQFAHADVGAKVLGAGAGLLLEKPLAHTIGDAARLRDLARGHVKVTAAVAFMLAFHPLFRSMRELINEGAIGTLKSYEATLRLSQVSAPKKGWIYTRAQSGGGVLINSGSHLVHMLIRLFGMPKEVSAESRRVHSTEVEDELKAQVWHMHGFEGSIDMNWAVYGHPVQSHTITVRGEGGTMTASDRQLVLVTPAGRKVVSEGEAVRVPFTLTPHYHGHGYYLEVADFIECIGDEKLAPEVGIDEAYQVQRYIEALYRSAASRESVKLETIP